MKTERREAYDALMRHYSFELADLDGEQWRELDEHYYVSNFGRVKSFWHKKSRILRPVCDKNGYLYVNLSVGGKGKNSKIHRLVAETFIPNPENKREVNHIDGHPLNNHMSNLEWATHSENMRHAFDTGLSKRVQGEDASRAKLTNEQIVYIRDNPDGLTCTQLVEMFNASASRIGAIQRGETYKNAGGKVRGKIERRIPDKVREQIRTDYKSGVRGFGCRALAKKYGVGVTTIRNIVKEGD